MSPVQSSAPPLVCPATPGLATWPVVTVRPDSGCRYFCDLCGEGVRGRWQTEAQVHCSPGQSWLLAQQTRWWPVTAPRRCAGHWCLLHCREGQPQGRPGQGGTFQLWLRRTISQTAPGLSSEAAADPGRSRAAAAPHRRVPGARVSSAQAQLPQGPRLAELSSGPPLPNLGSLAQPPHDLPVSRPAPPPCYVSATPAGGWPLLMATGQDSPGDPMGLGGTWGAPPGGNWSP